MSNQITHRDDSKPITKKRRYKAICDPGHGWLSVAYQDLIELNIVNDITRYSYIGSNRAYLEENADLATLIKAAMHTGWEVTITSSHSDNRSWVRSMAPYNPEIVRNPLVIGGKCKLLSTGEIMDVIDMTNNRIYVGYGRDAKHRINRTNPYTYVMPV